LFSGISMPIEHPNKKRIVEKCRLRQGTHAIGKHASGSRQCLRTPKNIRLQPSQVERNHWNTAGKA
jgi:hypothetical protein